MTATATADSTSTPGFSDKSSSTPLVTVTDRPTSPLVGDTPRPFPELCAHIHKRIEDFLSEKDVGKDVRAVQEQTRVSLGVIEEALDRYSLPELSLAYNGGKDCLVLLILYLCALHRKGLTGTNAQDGSSAGYHKPQCVYIQAPHPFAEVEEFVATSVKIYSLSLREYNKPMKAAFADYLRDKPSVKAIFVGTRRTDPHGENLTHFDQTDHGWPDFMRIHPVIDWHYVNIWTFIRHLRIPYCILYDRGYTSLGGTTDTYPNPKLATQQTDPASEKAVLTNSTNGAVQPQFRPAYELVDDDEERLGRDR